MAEEEEEDVLAEGGEGGDKAGKPSNGALPKILKFVAIGVGALIFIVTIVVVTFNVLNGSGKQAQATIPQTESYAAVKPPLASYELIGSINTTTSDTVPYSVSVFPILQYDIGDTVTQTELTARKDQLQDFMRSYFRGKKIDDLAPEKEGNIKNEIRELLNTTILEKARVRAVLFREFGTFSLE
jgi:flagellar FliL protein